MSFNRTGVAKELVVISGLISAKRDIADYDKKIKRVKAVKTARFHPRDALLQPITFQTVIDAVWSNERVKDKAAVERVFGEILKEVVSNAKHELRSEMKSILEEVKDDNAKDYADLRKWQENNESSRI